jgi:glycosyltransferase involved in cell wall biosynthesis
MLFWTKTALEQGRESQTMAKKTLISTLPPMMAGGVTTKARIMARALTIAGHDVTIAHYALGAGQTDASAFGDVRVASVPSAGHWFEQRYTEPSADWRALIDAHERHVAVGGTVLIANPLASAGVRHLVWCAADLAGDRGQRWRSMAWWRQIVDAQLVTPALLRQQGRVLAADSVVCGVSADTVERLAALAPDRAKTIRRLPIPVDADFFTPGEVPVHAGLRIGFAGRLDDPRKNANLLFATLAEIRARGIDANLGLTGEANPRLMAMAARHGVAGVVTFAGLLGPDALREFYRSLDVFLITSIHEGLAIAGLEAMASGVPVVSTRCGGPADYVTDLKTGRLCDFEAAELADAVIALTRPDVRAQFSQRARRAVELDFTWPAFERNLASAWRATWNESP